jgi:hypothetical protein
MSCQNHSFTIVLTGLVIGGQHVSKLFIGGLDIEELELHAVKLSTLATGDCRSPPLASMGFGM